MAQIFKAKTLVANSGKFAYEVSAPNLVYNTGDQNIGGLKNFTSRPTVNTIPVLLSGEVNTIISGVLYNAQINIKNDNGSTIYRGQPVYVSSAAGSNILVKLSSNSGEQTSSKTLGLVYQDSLAQNAQGTIVTEGLLQGFNTNAGEEGDPIWLGPSGSLIFGLANKPYAPNHLVYLGVLTRKQANQGEIFVKIQNGFELEELHNVNINHRNALADKNIIRYNSLSGIWFNDTIDSVLPNSIVYNTGNQIISGIKTFDVFPIISGNPFITGVNLTSYATSINLATTGSTLDSKINSLSGYVNSQDNVLSGQIVSTGTNLNNKINSLSGLFTTYTGSLDSTFATDAQLFTTGSILDNKINSLSGYVNSQDILFSGQTFNTGSRLDNKINSLSGYVDSKSIVLPSTIVYTTGNQIISGIKTFAENTIFGDPNQGDFLVISGNTFTIYGSGNFTSGLFVNGNPVLTGVDLSSYATVSNLFSTGSILNNKINSLSGYVNSQDILFSGQTFNTGSRLDNKINSLSGYTNSQDNIFSGQTFNTGSRLDNKINSLSGYVNAQNIIFSGQIVSTGSSLYNSILSLSGLFAGYTGNLDSNFASDAQLFNTGSILDNKINSLSGYVNIQDIIFSGQTFNTGSRLDNKINSLSGYVNSQDIIFSGQISSTGSLLDNKINALSGYVTGITGTFGTLPANLYATGSILDTKINALSGYVNYQDIVFSGQTFNTGSRLDNKINSLSGYLNSQNVIFSGQIASSGSSLYNSIIALSGLFAGYTGSLDASFATDAQLFATGSVLNDKINSLSGYVNSQDVVFSGQIASTGSILNNKLNSLSGYINFQDILFSGQTALTGSNLNDKINSLSGLFTNYTGNLDASFASDAQLFTTGSVLDNKINSLSGYTNSQDIIFSGQIFNTGSRLDTKINSLSGYLNSQDVIFSGQTALTGSILDNKINSLSGVSVLTFGDQLISGNKTFLNNISVSGSGIFNALDLNNIDILSLSGVDINITNGNVSLTNRPAVNGTGVVLIGELNPIIVNTGSLLDNKINSLSGYVNFKDIVFSGQIFNTGSRLNNKIDSLSGYVNSQDIIFSGQNFNTGSRLDNKINSLSGYVNSQDIIFSGQIALTGSNLNDKINSLSGLFVTYTGNLDATFASDAQLFATGSTLDNKINSLSGYTNSQDIIFSGQIFNTGSRLDTKINSLSGYVDSKSITLPSTIVYTTGDQLISGNKTFLNNIAVSGTGNFNNVKVSNIDKLFLSGIDIVITGNSSINVYNAIYISGNPVLTGIIPTTQTISNVVYTTGDQIISGIKTFINNINVSGTGNFNNVKVSNIDKLFLSGIDIVITGNSSINVYNAIYISGNPVLTGAIPTIPTTQTISNVVYATGNQTISGVKSFSDEIRFLNPSSTSPFYPTISGRSSNDGEAELDIDAFKLNLRAGYAKTEYIELGGEEGRLNINTVADTSTFNLGNGHNSSSTIIYNITSPSINLYGQVNGQTGTFQKLYADNLVYNTGNQTISGVKTFDVFPIVSGNKLITGIDLSSYATSANLFITGSTLHNKINSLSGYVNSQDIVFSGQIASSGSRLDNKINSISGYVNSQNIIFSGQIASTGSSLYNSIISLSGLFTGYTGFLDAMFASDIQLFNTGSVLDNKINSLSGNLTSIYATISNLTNTGSIVDNKINSLSGYVNSQDNVFSGQTFNTGSRLDNKINALSGYVNFQDIIFSGQTFNTGSRLDNKINSLSGFLNNNVVYVTGNQTILGQKTFSGTTTVIGHFAATSKSFLIDHPLDNNRKLQYASLEGPEHGVFLRGKTNENIINLPNYWPALVNENSISVNLTPISAANNIYVVDYNNTRIITNGNNGNYYFYTVYGERKDIPKLTVEF